MSALEERMTPIRVLVVDDEPLARRNVTVLLARDSDIGSVDDSGSGVEAIESIKESKPHLVFLDVQMPECGGFDILEMLGNELPAAIIFVTAHEEYALRAFEAGALDYLLKPFDDARFVRALARAKEKIAHYSPKHVRRPERLVVKEQGQVLFLDVAEVDWVEAAGYYACLHVGRATHVIRRALADLEKDLGEATFVRIHRSVIVNLARVHRLELRGSGEYEVALTTGARLPLSRRFKRGLQRRLGVRR
jgi:two-component system, LytTR family, response regulator